MTHVAAGVCAEGAARATTDAAARVGHRGQVFGTAVVDDAVTAEAAGEDRRHVQLHAALRTPRQHRQHVVRVQVA